MKLSHFVGLLAVFLLAPLATYGQERMLSSVEAMRFPRLPRMARIQGDVRLHSGSDRITLVSGHPLLDQAAIDNLKEIGQLIEGKSEVLYHFVLVDEAEIRVTKTTVKRGNRFERIILRAFLMKTEKVVESTDSNDENPPRQKNRIDFTKDPIEVWVYGVIASCLRI